MKKLISSLTLAIACVAKATVIDFDAAPEQYWIPSYSEAGYSFTLAAADGLGTLAGTVPVDYWNGNGTGRLMSWSNIGSVSGFTLSKTGGGSFSLNALDFGNGYVFGNDATTGLDVTGSLTGGGTVFQSFTYSGSGGLDSISFGSGWGALDSVLIVSNGAYNRTIYDNIVVDGQSVPDSGATLGLLLVGIAGLVGLRRSAVRA